MQDPRTLPLAQLRSVGGKRAALFAQLGLTTVGDLLTHYPHRYEDRTVFFPLSQLPDTLCCFTATVQVPVTRTPIRPGLDLYKTTLTDGVCLIPVTFFNAAYVKSALTAGRHYAFYGKYMGGEIQNPVFEPLEQKGRKTGLIFPVYRLCRGLSQWMVQAAVAAALELARPRYVEILPESLRQHYGLCGYPLDQIHRPADMASMEAARRRLAFEELLITALGLRHCKNGQALMPGLIAARTDLTALYTQLPFALTTAQTRCIAEILDDMRAGHPMNRLLQGDVGSGKTIVAAAAAVAAAQNGWQTALMAPTEILANQHYQTLAPLLAPLGIRTALLTGRHTPAQKRALYDDLSGGAIDFIIGTHALLSKGVAFARLGLVIADEQHRFGVAQRAALSAKGQTPHLLVMSATPIPRTLALIIHGDLNVSLLDERPPGRQRIKTYVVSEAMRPRIENFVRRIVARREQVYIICPLVEENEDLDLKAAETYARRMQTHTYKDLRVGLVHGRLTARQKEAVMADFAAGALDILIATTVIEVGVNIPNATLMIIEDAQRFGLSQLHQLRGRVGRSGLESHCVLFCTSDAPAVRERLAVMAETDDGFVMAERDLALRGPGDFFGARQHGIPHLKMADFLTDTALLASASQAAQDILSEGLARYPALQAAVDALFSQGLGQL